MATNTRKRALPIGRGSVPKREKILLHTRWCAGWQTVKELLQLVCLRKNIKEFFRAAMLGFSLASWEIYNTEFNFNDSYFSEVFFWIFSLIFIVPCLVIWAFHYFSIVNIKGNVLKYILKIASCFSSVASDSMSFLVGIMVARCIILCDWHVVPEIVLYLFCIDRIYYSITGKLEKEIEIVDRYICK